MFLKLTTPLLAALTCPLASSGRRRRRQLLQLRVLRQIGLQVSRPLTAELSI